MGAVTPISLDELARVLDARILAQPGTPLDTEITDIAQDNRRITAGSVFLALPGAHLHGATFAADAARRGAIAVVTDEAGLPNLAGELDRQIPVLVVDDVPRKAGRAAAAVYGQPATALTTFAVTGTNGKTTTAFYLEHILQLLGRTPGLIGTVAMRMAGSDVPAELTTPMPADLQRFLGDLVEMGGTDLAMEVSSHALSQGRTEPLIFSVAGFTNLTADHLDFHPSLEDYFEAKASLFIESKSKVAVITCDDEWGRTLATRLSGSRADSLWTIEGPGYEERAWEGTSNRVTWRGADGHLELTLPGGHVITTETNLPGHFNLANLALALTMIVASGIHPDALTHAVAGGVHPVVPGRMEVISDRPRIIVDFAHNVDALHQALSALRPSTKGRLITVTGSAGDRDREKRPLMGKVAAELSDLLIVTDDDPHSEDPAAIRAEILAGCVGVPTQVIEVASRSEAIRRAILEAGEHDTVMLAGRGHETIQEVAGEAIHLDDREEARAALNEWMETFG